MAQNLVLDPAKRDYVLLNGSSVPSDRIFEKAYYAIKIPQNNWQYGIPGQGSLVYTLEGKKHFPSTEQQFASYANDAINRQLVTKGDALAVNTLNIQTTPTGSSNQIQIVPNPSQLSDQLSFNQV